MFYFFEQGVTYESQVKSPRKLIDMNIWYWCPYQEVCVGEFTN